MHHVGCMASPESYMVQGPPSSSPIEGGGDYRGDLKYLFLIFTVQAFIVYRRPNPPQESLIIIT